MNILITGCTGQLGRSFRRAFLNLDHNCFFTSFPEGEGADTLDITDADAVMSHVRGNDIDIIINCSAYTDVEKAEEDEDAAFAVNASAVANLASVAQATGTLLIHFSTDYVFDGKACRPYSEDAPTAPANVYGRSKLAGEQAIVSSGCRYMIFRTAWLYSVYGKNFVKTMAGLTSRLPEVKVVCDQVGTPTYAQDLADSVVEIIEADMLSRTGIYNYTDEGVCSWYDLAKEVNDLMNHDCNVVPCGSEEYPVKAQRPAYSVLNKKKFKETFGIDIPHWRDSLYCFTEDFKRGN